MALKDKHTIDISSRTPEGGVKLYITDFDSIPDSAERLQLFREKLIVYASYVFSEKFANDFPGVSPQNVVISVVCDELPTEEMLAVTHVGNQHDAKRRLVVEFERGKDSKLQNRADVKASGSIKSVSDEVEALARAGNVIAAIKLYREQTGASLKEAKDVMDDLVGIFTF